jgi:hypothetical protein
MSEININDLGVTSDSQLKYICDELGIKLNFIGFEEDLLTQDMLPGGYILNIGNNKAGTHWVCLNIEDNLTEGLYFDSFAVPPGNDVIKWLNDNQFCKLIWNSIEEFQQMNEQLCGIWCIVALFYMQKKKGTMISRLQEMSYDF